MNIKVRKMSKFERQCVVVPLHIFRYHYAVQFIFPRKKNSIITLIKIFAYLLNDVLFLKNELK